MMKKEDIVNNHLLIESLIGTVRNKVNETIHMIQNVALSIGRRDT